MKLWKVELCYSWDRISSVESVHYFKTEEEAKDFTEKGNDILHRNKAYYCYKFYMDNNPIEFEIGEVNIELKKIEEKFKDYKY